MNNNIFRSMRVPKVERADLYASIPLSTPFQLVIDTTNACNFKCDFCPTGNPEIIKKSGRPFGNMDIELFKKIVDECKVFPKKIKRIDFGKDGEPFVNKNFPDMVRYLKLANITEMIAVTTNGALLTKGKIHEIISSGIDMIKISVEAVTDKKYKELTKVNIKYIDILEKVKYLYMNRNNCKIGVKIIDFNLSEYEKNKFYDDFNCFADFISIDQPSGWSQTTIKDFTLGVKPKGYLDLPEFNQKEV